MSWDGGMMQGGGLTDDDVGLRVPSLTAFITAKFSQGGVDPFSPCSQ